MARSEGARRTGIWLIPLLTLAVFGAPVAVADEEDDDPLCVEAYEPLDAQPERTKLHINYPARESNQLGEGWARFGMTIAPSGAITDIWLIDAMGSAIYGEVAARALADAAYTPPTIKGAPTQSGQKIDIEFRMVGENRAGVHNSFATAYARAHEFRRTGNYAASLAVLKEIMDRSLNLYEIATLSYALSLTYQGLNDWPRAYRHISHATIAWGEFADKGVRAAALSMAAEFSATAHEYRLAYCLFGRLKKKFPNYQVQPSLVAAIDDAKRQLSGTHPVQTNAEIIASDRPDVVARWGHEMLRGSFKIDQVQGNLSTYRLACPGYSAMEPVRSGVVLPKPPGRCKLHVFGDPGARFVLDER